MSTWAQDDAELFADMFAEFGIANGMTYGTTTGDIVKTPANPSFEMMGNNYDRSMFCDVLCLRSTFPQLVLDWRASSGDKRPTVTVAGEIYQAMEMKDDEAGLTVVFTCRLKQ